MIESKSLLRSIALVAAVGALHCGTRDARTVGPDGGEPGSMDDTGVFGGGGGEGGSGFGSEGPGDPDRTPGDPGPFDPGDAGPAGPGRDSPNTADGYMSLAPALGQPLDPDAAAEVSPAPPKGWKWYPIEGTQCRNGSQAGLYARFTDSDKLFIYFEGGGACTSSGFCNYNPASVNQVIAGRGETVLGSALGAVEGRQQPGVYENNTLAGVFDPDNSNNPFRNWNGIYIPYCTGDVHAGTNPDTKVPGVQQPQQFVGHANMKKFVGRIVPTFRGQVNRVVLMGVSAGSYGAALNFSMIQDAFGEVTVDALLDSGPPFADEYMPACMQKYWRELWGLNDMLPPDCEECFHKDGGGLINLADFLVEKHPNATLGLVSSMEDEIIRLFFSMGENDCANIETADPVLTTGGKLFDPSLMYPGSKYKAGLQNLRERYVGTGRFATYYMSGTLHQHVFRPRFTKQAAGNMTIAQFAKHFLAGEMKQVGP